ncbi:unnamed protein product, partial [Rhizophagus irregularis]
MVVFNKTLQFLIITFTLLLITVFAQEPITYNENLYNLRFEGSDTYKDGTIILLFTQGNNQTKFLDTKIHLRIIFVNRTILPVEIDYSSISDFIPQCNSSVNPLLCATTLTPKALVERYILIESSRNGISYKQMIVSWDGIIHDVYKLQNKYQVEPNLDSKQEFFITELYNATTLVWRKFIVQNPNNLKEENGIYNISKDNTLIYSQNTFPLIEGGYATIMFMQTAGPNNITIHEIYVIYFRDNISIKQHLLYSSISGNTLNLAGDCKNSFDGSGNTFFFTDLDGSKPDIINPQNYNYFRIHFLSNGAISFVDTNYFDIRKANFLDYSAMEIIPLFYGGYLGFNRLIPDNKLIIIYDDNINIKQTLNLTYSFNKNGLNSFVMQKQSLLWFFNYDNIQTWNINYYPLNSIDVTDSRYIYQNPTVSETYPKINEYIQISGTNRNPFDFIINYNKPIALSTLEALDKSTNQATFTVRLNFDNKTIKIYNEINSKDSPLLQQFKDELVQAIPVDPKRLTIEKTLKIQNENSIFVLIFITIMPPYINDGIERSTNSVLKDLNELIYQ